MTAVNVLTTEALTFDSSKQQITPKLYSQLLDVHYTIFQG